MKKLIIILLVVTGFSCTDAKMAKLGGLGSQFKVEMINCDGISS